MIVADWVRGQALRRGDRPALLLDGGRAVTWAQLDADVTAFCGALSVAGAAQGARVAAVLRNGRTLTALVHACARVRALLVLIDPRLAPREAAAQARATAPTLVVADESTLDGGRAVATAGGGAVVAISRLDAARSDRAVRGARAALAKALAPALRATTGAPPCGAAPADAPTIDLEAPHTVVFSSGTAGVARPIVLTAGNHLWSALSSAALLGSLPEDRWLACLPMAHVGGLSIAIRAALSGATVRLQQRFDAEAVCRVLLDEGISLLSLVPTALARTLDALGGRRRRFALRAVLVGGAGATRELLVRARERGLPAAPTYGLTEAASQVATLAPWQPLGEAGFVGQALPATRVRIARGEGTVAAAGEEGLIEIAGATLAAGLLRQAKRRSAALRLEPLVRRDGWFATGDRGRLDAQGGLTVLGRADDVIVTGGENVAPDAVEAAILDLGMAADVGVAAVPDAVWGQAVAAWIVPRAGASPTLEAIRSHLRARLAPHQLPRRLYLVEALPRTALGKLRRKALRDGAAQGANRR